MCFDYVHREIEIMLYWSMQCTNQQECVGFLLIWTAFSSSERSHVYIARRPHGQLCGQRFSGAAQVWRRDETSQETYH
jgi:hypothetical protein